MNSVELFTGAGGLALGVSASGFKHLAVVEWDHDACNTVRLNQERGNTLVGSWPLHEMDVAQFNFDGIEQEVDLLGGGPPCQPFSLGGKHKGHTDERNMFPQVFRAARSLRPKAILIENVKGLARASFKDYLDYILLQLGTPEIQRKRDEEWRDHAARLVKVKSNKVKTDLEYDVQVKLINSADYGVPQRRERVIIVGFRRDLGVKWTYPPPTHSHEALLYSQWVTGEYWERHGVPKKHRPSAPSRYKGKIENLKTLLMPPAELPWVTVRDALTGMPCPERDKEKKEFENHHFNPGARSYPGHTGSPLDEPAKTLKAGDHGVPGGENMLLRPDGTIRYFTVRECARLQTFPDNYVFTGAWSEAMRQLGNAVPMRLAEIIATRIKEELVAAKNRGKSTRGRNRSFEEPTIQSPG
ncbi:MAG: DNA cytosine methyltransferase [Bdellovibrionales bacterium]